MSASRAGKGSWRVVEVTDVTDRAIEEAMNAASSEGWRFESIHFAVQQGSRRPAMAFLFFSAGPSPGGE